MRHMRKLVKLATKAILFGIFAVILFFVLSSLSGCLSVVRLGKLDCANGYNAYNEETRKWEWHQYTCEACDPLSQFGLYPTWQLRWQMLRLTWNWAPPEYYWQRRLALPAAWILLLPGGVVDFAVDTLALPWDWKYRANSRDLVEDELPEKLTRSKCVSCGAVSDGEFSVCYKDSERNTKDYRKMYGVCPQCTETVKTNGYYFTRY